MRFARTLSATVVTVLVATPGLAAAQEPVRDFSQLNTRLKPGDTIWVTNAQGREIKGRITSLAPDALAVNSGGVRTFTASDVTTIGLREPDSLRNGALIGLGVGGGLAAVACIAANSDGYYNEAGWCAAVALIYAGIGAGIGVGVDALIPGKKIVAYRAPGSTGGTSHARLSIAPLVTRRARGAAITFAF